MRSHSLSPPTPGRMVVGTFTVTTLTTPGVVHRVYTDRPVIEVGRRLEAEGFARLEAPVTPDNVDG
jgi:hypothetical protein